MKIFILLLTIGIALASKAEKMVYDLSTGKIISIEPSAARIVAGKLQSKQVQNLDWAKVGFGEGTITHTVTQSVVSTHSTTNSGITNHITTTNYYLSSRRNANVADIADFRKLYPLSAAEYQTAKSAALKTIENRYLKFCDSLAANTNHTAMTIDQLRAKWGTLTAAQKIEAAVTFILIDAEGRLIGGENWKADCGWHGEIAE